jgi:hypothetical protein
MRSAVALAADEQGWCRLRSIREDRRCDRRAQVHAGGTTFGGETDTWSQGVQNCDKPTNRVLDFDYTLVRSNGSILLQIASLR